MRNIKTEIEEFDEMFEKLITTEGILLNRAGMELLTEMKNFLDDKLNPDSVYPKDVFPELQNWELRYIETYCEEVLKFPLDRLSAHIGRKLLENLRKEIIGE